MKKIVLFIVLIIAVQVYDIAAQPHGRRGERYNKKIEELRKIKIIETLDMNEETTLKFFSRYSKHREAVRELHNKADELLLDMEKSIHNNEKEELSKGIDQFISNEKKIVSQREEFLSSLSDILSDEQIAKYLVFEQRFREEIRDIILRDRRGRDN